MTERIRRIAIINRLLRKGCFTKKELLTEIRNRYDANMSLSSLNNYIKSMQSLGAPIMRETKSGVFLYAIEDNNETYKVDFCLIHHLINDII